MSKKNFLVTDKSIFHDDFNTFFKKYVVSNYHDDLIDIEESFKKENECYSVCFLNILLYACVQN